MLQGCPVQLWPCYQVTTPHRPGHLRTSVCPNYLTHLTHSHLSTLSIHCIIFIPIGTILSLLACLSAYLCTMCYSNIIFHLQKKIKIKIILLSMGYAGTWVYTAHEHIARWRGGWLHALLLIAHAPAYLQTGYSSWSCQELVVFAAGR